MINQKVNQDTQNNASLSFKDQEMILVVKREKLFFEGDWQGLKEVCFDSYTKVIDQHKEFIARRVAEQNPVYKQIIPYLIFYHDETYFLMQRSENASESRLQNKYSLGIGGHVREEDMQEQTLFDWARREFYEEVSYQGSVSVKPLGILNDDKDEVGKVHAGFVFLIEGNNSTIAIKSELKSGRLVPLEECMQYNKNLESWSQIVLSHLLDQKYGNTPRKCCC